MMSPRRRFSITLIVIVVLFAVVSIARATDLLAPEKRKLPRDNVYYEITNDGNDHGNYIETYHVPDGQGGKVYCVVYSDKIGDGGGAGMSCDWEHSQ